MAAAGSSFDASKQAKAPLKFLHNAPEDLPAVRVGLVSPTIGYGLFAARDFAQGEFIFHEAPIMTALFSEKFSTDKVLVDSQYEAYKTAVADGAKSSDRGRRQKQTPYSQRTILHAAFPIFAASHGFEPMPFENVQPILDTALGRNLVHGSFDGSIITQAEYEAHCAQVKANASPSEEASREACLDFFRHYAFMDEEVLTSRATTSTAAAASKTPACIYLLGSLVNHCCTPSSHNETNNNHHRSAGPNCAWRIGSGGLAKFVGDQHILVEAKRAIKEGEQLTWDYGKREKGFVCECETCRRAGSLSYKCGIL